jgi:acyl carrier protein
VNKNIGGTLQMSNHLLEDYLHKMQYRDVVTKILGVVSKHSGRPGNTLNLNMSFIDDLQMDPNSVASLVMDCESMFELQVDNKMANRLRTISQLVNYINSKLINKNNQPKQNGSM